MVHKIFSSKNKPTFLIIGAQKCGTTSLFYYLSQHPQLNLPALKEIHFFDLEYERGIDWYYRSFPKNPFLHNKLTGEASPYYLFHPLVPERVFKHLPKIKIIVLLRNPVDRAYSQYNHQRKLGNEPIQSFEEAIINEELRISEEEEKLKLGILKESHAFRRYSYIKRGLYSVQIERWLQYFTMSQMLFIKSEDFFECPNSVLNEVYDFLKIRRILPQSLTPQNTNDYPEIDFNTRENLRSYFEVDSKKLKALLGEKFSWE